MLTFRKVVAVVLLLALCLCCFAPAAAAKKSAPDPDAVFIKNITALDAFIRANKNYPNLTPLLMQYLKNALPDMDMARLNRCLALYLSCNPGIVLETKLEAYAADIKLNPSLSDIIRSGKTPEAAAERAAFDRRMAGLKIARTPLNPGCIIDSNGTYSAECYCRSCNSCKWVLCP